MYRHCACVCVGDPGPADSAPAAHTDVTAQSPGGSLMHLTTLRPPADEEERSAVWCSMAMRCDVIRSDAICSPGYHKMWCI